MVTCGNYNGKDKKSQEPIVVPRGAVGSLLSYCEKVTALSRTGWACCLDDNGELQYLVDGEGDKARYNEVVRSASRSERRKMGQVQTARGIPTPLRARMIPGPQTAARAATPPLQPGGVLPPPNYQPLALRPLALLGSTQNPGSTHNFYLLEAAPPQHQ